MITKFYNIIIILVMAIFIFNITCFSDEPIIEIQAYYLAYSYDWNILYGEDNVEIKLMNTPIVCQWIKIDFNNNILIATGNVSIKNDKILIVGDEFVYNIAQKKGSIITFGEKIQNISYPNELSINEGSNLSVTNSNLVNFSKDKIENSFLYYVTSGIDVFGDLKLKGYNVTAFLEGVPSFHFKTFKLKSAPGAPDSGLSLSKFRFNNSQGLNIGVSYNYSKPRFFASTTNVDYEERSIIKNNSGPKRIERINTENRINFSPNDEAIFSAYYDSVSTSRAKIRLNHKFSEKYLSSIEILHSSLVNQKPENWISLENEMKFNNLSNLNTNIKYELQNQLFSSVNYSQQFASNFQINFNSSFNRRGKNSILGESKLYTGGIDLNYDQRYFSISTGYMLNQNLIADQSLSQPKLIFQLKPYPFYSELLSMKVSNTFYYNTFKIAGQDDRKTFSNNVIFNLSSEPIALFSSTAINVNFRIEQLLRNQQNSFTSAGLMLSLFQSTSKKYNWEIIYSYQTRRPTRNWLIEGINSHNITGQLRINPWKKLIGRIAISADPEESRLKNSNINLLYEIGKRWFTETWIAYDFQLHRLNNLDIILIKDIHRADIKFKWRHLTKQFLVEFTPKFR